MPYSKMMYKAGKFTFLLVCLFLCTACRNKQETVFEAGAESAEKIVEEKIENALPESEQVSGTEQKTNTQTLVNINTAGIEELMRLPGIGEVRASAIIEYLKSVGVFEKIEDIMNVKGIKTGIFNKINHLICVK